LHKRLGHEAEKADRSLNQEMLIRLQQTFARSGADRILDEARTNVALAQKLYDQTMELYHRIGRHTSLAAYLLTGTGPGKKKK
jgi:hypothetical protein